jgi:(E)-4-hydroxy-3-methylbut-2-enyl-diphosphate synthase
MRIKSPVVQIGGLTLGGKNPVAIQSMTNTDTADVKATVKQVIELAKAGSELVRVTVNDEAAAKSVPKIRAELNKKGYQNLPLIGDFHFNGHLLLMKFPEMAKALDKYRINPGNVGYGVSHDANFETIIRIAIKNNKPVRIGVNFGSIDQEVLKKAKGDFVKAMVNSALESAKLAEKLGMKQNKIILSVKASDVTDTVKAYELLAEQMTKNKHFYALHLGLTEAGSGDEGIVASTSALAILLEKGIGDTIRISLTPSKDSPRTKEVEVCQLLLQSLNLRNFFPRIISCPGCGRAANDLFQKIALDVKVHLAKKTAKNPNLKTLKVAIMGCIVNGPGEAKSADIALVLPGKNERNIAQVFIKGKLVKTLNTKNILKEFLEILNHSF